MTNGPITPNYVIDLYLPIIGFEGLGLLTTLYRVAINDVKAIAVLNELARAGRVGFRLLDKLLSLLDELEIVKVMKPQGENRGRHLKTIIELLDAPAKVPAKFVETVLDRTLTRWMIAEANCYLATGELLSSNSPVARQQLADSHLTTGELLPSNFMNKEDVPIINVPMNDVTTHTARARECGGQSNEEHLSRHAFDVVLAFAETQQGIKSPLAVAELRFKDGHWNSKIDQWLAEKSRREEIARAGMPGERDDELLKGFLSAVQSRVNKTSFDQWFAPVRQLNRAGQGVYLLAPTEQSRDWIMANYADILGEVLSELGFKDSKVEFCFYQ